MNVFLLHIPTFINMLLETQLVVCWLLVRLLNKTKKEDIFEK